MGLFGRFSISLAPCVLVEVACHDGLAAFVHMDVLYYLLARLVEPDKGFNCCS
jgi:hypothetical protein